MWYTCRHLKSIRLNGKSFSVGEKSVVQKRESFDGDGSNLDQIGPSGENVSGSVAAFVTTGGQNINIIHG